MNNPSLDSDVPELRRKLASTEKALARAEQLALAGRFAGTVMHEINNPLEAVTNLVYLTRALPLSEEAQEYLRLIEEQLGRVREISRQTLALYRESEKPSPADLVELIRVVLRIYAKPLSDKGMKLELELPVSAVFIVYPGELTQAISNLVSNAIDASQQGGRLRIRLRSAGKSAHVTICDSGVGIAEPLRRTLFEAFQSGKEFGHGLGLWVCQRVVEKHGGRIRWRSSTRPGRSGTTFRISLRQQAAAPERAA